jgi:hypothetical protein
MGARRHDVTMRSAFILAVLFLIVPAQAAKQSATPNRFGAIAYHRASQSWGVSYDTARARDAGVEALRQCSHRQCEVVHRFRNGCGALADGPKVQAAASGATRDEAETRALRRCTEANRAENCKLLAWACTR